MAGLDWMTKPVIEGTLVRLRPFVPTDISPAWEMVNDPVGNRLTATTEQFDYDQIRRWYESRNGQPLRLDLAIEERATGDFAGEVVLNAYDQTTESCSFRISLRGPAWFGRGLGTEATSLIIDYGFGQLGLERIDLEVLAENGRARRAYEKVGFVETGRYDETGPDETRPGETRQQETGGESSEAIVRSWVQMSVAPSERSQATNN
jgi:RimJ/RimL family protein N-acetyltransferase